MAGGAWETTIADAAKERLPVPMGGVVRRLRSEDVLLLSAGLSFYALVSGGALCSAGVGVNLITGKAASARSPMSWRSVPGS